MYVYACVRVIDYDILRSFRYLSASTANTSVRVCVCVCVCACVLHACIHVCIYIKHTHPLKI